MHSVFVIGDSISVHYGPYLEQYLAPWCSYARKSGVEEALKNLDHPQGANGGDSSAVLAYLQAMYDGGGIDCELMLLNCGLHDIKTDPKTGAKQVPIQTYEENLYGIVGMAGLLGVQLIWVRTTPADEAVHNTPHSSFHRFAADCDAYNAIADRIMMENDIPIIDLHTFTSSLGGELFCDHVHFPEHIREKQAAYIAGWLQAYVTV